MAEADLLKLQQNLKNFLSQKERIETGMTAMGYGSVTSPSLLVSPTGETLKAYKKLVSDIANAQQDVIDLRKLQEIAIKLKGGYHGSDSAS